jgi:hypothetical protein
MLAWKKMEYKKNVTVSLLKMNIFFINHARVGMAWKLPAWIIWCLILIVWTSLQYSGSFSKSSKNNMYENEVFYYNIR